MLKVGRPPEAIVGKGVELIREWAERKSSLDLIGKQISSVVVPAAIDEPAAARYHSDVAQSTSYGITEVIARSDMGLAWKSELTAKNGGLDAVPTVGRNVPCPCGSGKKYKRCHGQPAHPHRTMVIELQRGRRKEDGEIEWPP